MSRDANVTIVPRSDEVYRQVSIHVFYAVLLHVDNVKMAFDVILKIQAYVIVNFHIHHKSPTIRQILTPPIECSYAIPQQIEQRSRGDSMRMVQPFDPVLDQKVPRLRLSGGLHGAEVPIFKAVVCAPRRHGCYWCRNTDGNE